MLGNVFALLWLFRELLNFSPSPHLNPQKVAPTSAFIDILHENSFQLSRDFWAAVKPAISVFWHYWPLKIQAKAHKAHIDFLFVFRGSK